ncbi:MAG TPA: tetratricopeptide repeat protein [Thermoanaerobaculia bacterium]|nr:tetratricopeptide repeat protein [Thermoanaerobaculia bacterium]
MKATNHRPSAILLSLSLSLVSAIPATAAEGGCKTLRLKALSASGPDAVKLLGEAQTACREELQAFSRDAQPVPWAVAALDLANVVADRAIVTGGATAPQGLDEAVGLYRQALEVLADGRSPEVWAAAQMNLGSALQSRGIRTPGTAGLPFLQEAADRLRQALSKLTPEKNPQDWAETQNNLGLALAELGARKGKTAGATDLEQAFQAFGEVQKVYTLEKQPRRWSDARFTQARVRLAQEDFEEAAPILRDVLAKDPDNRRALLTYASLLVGRLDRPAEAVTLTSKYVERHPEDVEIQMLHLDNLYAAGRIADNRLRVASLTEKSAGLPAAIRIHLMGYEIATGLATGSKEAMDHLNDLVNLIATQPTDFRLPGNFAGSLRFIQARPEMRNSDWQIQLFHALQNRNGRDAMLADLRKLQSVMEAAPAPAPAKEGSR